MKIRFCSFLTIALFLLPALQGAERDSLSLLRTIAEYEALPAKWIETVYTNPATRYYQHCTSLTRISLNGVYGKEDEAALLQAGDGYLKGAADVSSWIKLSDRTRLWGNARYTTGKETETVDIEWHEAFKRIHKKNTDKGTEVGIRMDDSILSRGLYQDDVIYADDEKLVVVNTPPCEVIRVTLIPGHEKMSAKVCYEIGNRHAPLFWGENDTFITI